MSQGLETLAGLGPWAHIFSEQSYWWNLSWKTRANSSAFLVSLPANEAMHVPSPNACKPTWKVLGAQFFGTIALMEFVKENPCQQVCFWVRRSSPQAISHGFPSLPYRSFPTESSLRAISHGFPSVHPVIIPVSLLPLLVSASLFPYGAPPMLFPTVSLPSTPSSFPYRSFPTELSPSYFPWFPFRPPCCHSRIAALPNTLASLPYRSFPPELSPCYFRIAPSHQSFPHAISHGFPAVHRSSSSPYRSFRTELPHAISHGFPSVHPLVASISFLPNGALPKLFPKVSKLLPTVSLLSTSRRFHIAPSHRSSPRANFHGFPPVHPLVASASLLPTGALPMLISTVSAPSTLSSLPHRSFPPELSPSYFPRFPFRPPCRHSRIAPSHRSSSQAISHGFRPFHPLVASASLLPTGALPKLALPMLISTVSAPSTLSSLPQRSFPPELFPSYFPRFPPFHLVASTSLLPTGALPKLFPTVSPLPPSRRFRIAPSHRSSPHANFHGFRPVDPLVASAPLLPTGALPKLFSTLSLPSTLPSLPYRSFATELSHGFPSVHPVVIPVSLLPTGALPKLFPTVSFHPLVAPSHRSSPHAISHGFPPSTLSSLPSRYFPTELSPCYFPRLPLRPPSRRFHLAPSPRNSPHAISRGFPSVHPIIASIRSLPMELSPSYFPRFPLRPPSRHFRIAPSRQSD